MPKQKPKVGMPAMKKPRSAGGLQTMELRPGDAGHSATMGMINRMRNAK
jgi:hypothetical protein